VRLQLVAQLRGRGQQPHSVGQRIKAVVDRRLAGVAGGLPARPVGLGGAVLPGPLDGAVFGTTSAGEQEEERGEDEIVRGQAQSG
jgi:hypothetical protein